MKKEVYIAFPLKRPPCDSIDGYVTSRPQRTAQHLKIFLPNKKKFSCLDCKCGDKTLNNGRILKTNICGWKWDIYWTRHCFNGCSYCGSRPRGRWRKRMRETQKLRVKRGKKNYGCVYLDSRRTALSGPLLLKKGQRHQRLRRSFHDPFSVSS